MSIGRTADQIAIKLNRKEKEIKNSIRALSEADLYLTESAKAEGDYARVGDDAEQFFKDLPSLLEDKDAGLQEASRLVAWTLFDNRKSLGERLYNFNVSFGRRAADVLDRTASELGIALQPVATTSSTEQFSVDIEDEGGAVAYDGLLDALRDPLKKEDATETLINVCRGIVDSERNKKSANAAEKAVNAAHGKLIEVDLTKASSSTYLTIERQLTSIIARATALKGTLAQLQAAAAGKTDSQ